MVFLLCLLTVGPAQAADPKNCDLPPAQAGSHFEGSATWAGARKMDEGAASLQTPESIKSKKMYVCRSAREISYSRQNETTEP